MSVIPVLAQIQGCKFIYQYVRYMLLVLFYNSRHLELPAKAVRTVGKRYGAILYCTFVEGCLPPEEQ